STALTRSPKARHHFGGWSHDGDQLAFSANREDASRFDLYVQKRTDKTARRLARGPGGFFTPTGWSPDDRTLLVAREESSTNQDVYLVDSSGTLKLLTKHKGEVQYDGPRWSADGKHVWCLSTHGGRDRPAVARIEVSTGKLTYAITPKDEVDEVLPSPKGRWLAWTVNAGGRSELHLRDLKGNRETRAPELPLGGVSELCFSPDDSALAFTFNGPRHNGDVWLWPLADARGNPAVGKKLKQLTFSSRAGIPFSKLVVPELIHYRTFDGRMIPAWYY